MANQSELIARLPKAELHLHIEGSLEPELMFELAERNQVEIPYNTVEEIRSAYAFSNLQEFLDIYYQGMAVLLVRQDYYDLTWAYIERCRSNNIVHCEIFFDPQAHTDRGIKFEYIVQGIASALADALEKHAISSRLIMCFLRHLDEQSAFETLEHAQPYLHLLHGVGLDSSEQGHPPGDFARVFSAARALGLKAVAHAGEEGPPEYVYEALDKLKVDRIDHGNRAMEDGKLVARLAKEQMPLTVCPLSNFALKVVDDLARHPIPQMLNEGLLATLNSDDPAYFGGYLNENFMRLARHAELSDLDIITLVKNSFKAAFLPSEDIQARLADVDRLIGD